ncbi:MAG: hypothetical protein ABF265_01810 [Polaribacter sp.]
MVTTIVLLIALALVFFLIGQLIDADIIISPIIGIVFGALYSVQDFKEIGENYKEHTLQCCIGFISLTVLWVEKIE